MIDYAYLCQAIVDWRAGRRPTLPPSATPTLSGSGVTSTAPIELYPDQIGAEAGDAAAYQAAEYDGAQPSEADGAYGDEAAAGYGAAVEADDEAGYLAADEEVDSDLVEVEAPLEGDAGDDLPLDDAAAAAPPDYDSTMVYGAGADVPAQPQWDGDGPSVEVDEEVDVEAEPRGG